MTSKLLAQLKEEDFWSLPCIHSGEFGVEAEHSFEYARKQIQERWAIVPVKRKYNRNPTSDIKEKSQLYAMNQAKTMGVWERIKRDYPKKNWDNWYAILMVKYNKT